MSTDDEDDPRSVQIARRHDAVARLIGTALDNSEIERAIAQAWGVTERQVRRDIATVYERMAAEEEPQRPRRRVQMRATLWATFHKCKDAGDYKAGVTYLDKLCRMDGLYAPTKIEMGMDGLSDDELLAKIKTLASEALVEMTDAELAALIAQRGALREET